MPALVARAHEEGRAADRLAEAPAVEELPRRLVRAAEEGVGGAADAEAAAVGLGDEGAGLGEGEAEGFLGVDVLSGREDVAADRDVGGGNGEVDHDLDAGVGEERGNAGRRDPELRPAARGCGRIEVGDRAEVEDREEPRGGEVGAADVAAADDADTDAFHGAFPIQSRRRGGRRLPRPLERVTPGFVTGVSSMSQGANRV